MLEDYWDNFVILLSLLFVIPFCFFIVFFIFLFILICFPVWVGYVLIKQIYEED